MSEQVTSNHVNQGERVRLMCVGVLAGAIAGLVTGIEARIKMRIIALATGSVPGLSLATLVILLPSQTAYVPYILMSIFLIILGMSGLGIATLLGKQLNGLQQDLRSFQRRPTRLISTSILSSSAFGVSPGYSSAMWSSRTQPNSSRPNITLHLEQPSTHRRENCLP